MDRTANDEALQNELDEALKLASDLIQLARKYFPKSIKHPDKFTLELTAAAVGKLQPLPKIEPLKGPQ